MVSAQEILVTGSSRTTCIMTLPFPGAHEDSHLLVILALQNRHYCFHYTDEKAEAQEGSTCPGHTGSPGLGPRTCGSVPSASGQASGGLWEVAWAGKGPWRGSLSINAAAIDGGPSAIQIRHLVLLIQEVQRVVAWEAADGELVGHLGPVLTVGGHTLIQLCCFGEQVLQKPVGVKGQDDR